MVEVLFLVVFFVFFFNDTATTEIYTLSLHDALPIFLYSRRAPWSPSWTLSGWNRKDRKSTRLNSSHTVISYAVFCLKKKKHNRSHRQTNKKHKKKTNRTQKTTS